MCCENSNDLERSLDGDDKIDDFYLEINGNLKGILDEIDGSDNNLPIEEASILNQPVRSNKDKTKKRCKCFIFLVIYFRS